VLVAILLLVPTRHWWAYALASSASHFIASQQVGWPALFALQAEAFDVTQNLLAAGAIRRLIKSPFDVIGLREAVIFVLIAVIVGPMATSPWGAALTVAYGFGTDLWKEWRDLSISNAVTAMVLIPPILVGARRLATRQFSVRPMRVVEAGALAACLVGVGLVVFNSSPAGPDTSPALLYAPIPLLIWAALRFGIGGVGTAMLAITMIAIWGTMHGHGPFLTQTPEDNATALQLFLLIAATPLMLLAAAINDEHRSQEALRRNEERMSLALESAQLALWDWDATTDDIWITDEGRRLFGFEPGEPVHYADLTRRVHPDDTGARALAIQSALETGRSYEMEYRVVQPDGSVRWITARGRRARATGDASQRIVGVSMDTTRAKQAGAEALAQQEQLAHLSRVATVSALSGSLAHELSQPLSSILINAQAGSRSTQTTPPDLVEVRAIFADIVGECLRAGEIMNGLRTMLRRGQVVLQPVNVNDCVDDLLRLLHADLIARGVTVSKAVADGLPLAMTDRVQLHQVLLNLIVNACEAMAANAPGDRHITLVTSLKQGHIHIGVLDWGVGLPKDPETLFQPFHSTKTGGMGIGLSICRALVTSHGGRLWAERRLERGAAFYVSLVAAR
jgi:PAS domain S-box-containing protein